LGRSHLMRPGARSVQPLGSICELDDDRGGLARIWLGFWVGKGSD
jgi:hypothetical protein